MSRFLFSYEEEAEGISDSFLILHPGSSIYMYIHTHTCMCVSVCVPPRACVCVSRTRSCLREESETAFCLFFDAHIYICLYVYVYVCIGTLAFPFLRLFLSVCFPLSKALSFNAFDCFLRSRGGVKGQHVLFVCFFFQSFFV